VQNQNGREGREGGEWGQEGKNKVGREPGNHTKHTERKNPQPCRVSIVAEEKGLSRGEKNRPTAVCNGEGRGKGHGLLWELKVEMRNVKKRKRSRKDFVYANWGKRLPSGKKGSESMTCRSKRSQNTNKKGK